MVLLDQKGVVQAQAMVVATATAHRIFLCQSQARQGLAGVEQLHRVVAHQIGKLSRAGCGRRERLQKVECSALPGQQCPCRSMQTGEQGVGRHFGALFNQPFDADCGVEQFETAIDPGTTAHHGCIAAEEGGFGLPGGRNQLCGQIAAADVFVERCGDVGGDFGHWRKGAVGHDECSVWGSKKRPGSPDYMRIAPSFWRFHRRASH